MTSTPIEEISDDMLRDLLTTEQITPQRYMEEMERRKSVGKKIEDGGPAFPHPGGANDVTVQTSHLGLSLRDWFAGQAINGICAGLCADSSNGYAASAFSRVGITEAAKDSYLIADAMLAARKSGGEA